MSGSLQCACVPLLLFLLFIFRLRYSRTSGVSPYMSGLGLRVIHVGCKAFLVFFSHADKSLELQSFQKASLRKMYRTNGAMKVAVS